MAGQNPDLAGVWKDRVARKLEPDIDCRTNVQKDGAGILQAPLHVRNIENSLGRPTITRKIDLCRHSQFVLRSMDTESPMNLNFRSALQRNLAIHAIGSKRHLRKLRALQHFRM